MPCRFGSWLGGADLFDCAAFSMSAAEAKVADPQQRLVLEVAAAVLPSGRGMTADAAEWQPCGVFTGISSMDYARLTEQHGMNSTAFSATGDPMLSRAPLSTCNRLDISSAPPRLSTKLPLGSSFCLLMMARCRCGRYGPQRCGWSRGLYVRLAGASLGS